MRCWGRRGRGWEGREGRFEAWSTARSGDSWWSIGVVRDIFVRGWYLDVSVCHDAGMRYLTSAFSEFSNVHTRSSTVEEAIF